MGARLLMTVQLPRYRPGVPSSCRGAMDTDIRTSSLQLCGRTRHSGLVLSVEMDARSKPGGLCRPTGIRSKSVIWYGDGSIAPSFKGDKAHAPCRRPLDGGVFASIQRCRLASKRCADRLSRGIGLHQAERKRASVLSNNRSFG